MGKPMVMEGMNRQKYPTSKAEVRKVKVVGGLLKKAGMNTQKYQRLKATRKRRPRDMRSKKHKGTLRGEQRAGTIQKGGTKGGMGVAKGGSLATVAHTAVVPVALLVGSRYANRRHNKSIKQIYNKSKRNKRSKKKKTKRKSKTR